MVRMLFLVDGYNITKGDPETCALTLEVQRDALVSRLRARGTQLLGRGRIVVFFDGDADMPQSPAGRSASYPVEVVYSRGTSADDAIVERAAGSSCEPVCVVSSDGGLAGRAKARTDAHVEVRPRESLYEHAPNRRSRRQRSGLAREAGLPPGASAITKELKGLWLEDEE